MPKKLSEDHNNSLRRENGYEEKRKKSTKNDFIRVKNGYICPFGRFMRLVEIKNGLLKISLVCYDFLVSFDNIFFHPFYVV